MATTAFDVSRQAPISHPDRLYIGGEWVKPHATSHIDVIAPATEELFLRVAEAQEADIAKAVAAAREAFAGGMGGVFDYYAGLADIKASPEAPGAAYIIAEIAESVGLPPGVINVITANRGASESLVRHPGVDKITFTGSSAVGKRIASLCGERVARCTLELGGKSAAVVLDDYDIETAAQAIAGPACALTGQICSSLTPIVVTRHRHDAMVAALSAIFGAVRVGDPFDASSQMGPVVSRRQLERIEALIAKGKEEGAVLASGGNRPKHLTRGFYIEPTVFGNAHNHSTLAREEIFGPVLTVIPADHERHAVEIANDTVYGLNNSVFTNDPDRAYAVARELRSGTVGHNMFRSDFGIAFGGFKQSGLGREGGVEGLLPFLEAKTIILDGAPARLTLPSRSKLLHC